MVVIVQRSYLNGPDLTHEYRVTRIYKGVLSTGRLYLDLLPKFVKVEIFLEQKEVAFLSSSKISENLNFSTEIQIFAKFAG